MMQYAKQIGEVCQFVHNEHLVFFHNCLRENQASACCYFVLEVVDVMIYPDSIGLTVSELVRQSVLQRIQDEYDFNAFSKAEASYLANAVTYSLDEVEKELGLQ